MSDSLCCAQSCPTLCNTLDSAVHGIFQARILEWVAISSFPIQGLNPCLLHCQVDSLPLSHQGSQILNSYSKILIFTTVHKWTLTTFILYIIIHIILTLWSTDGFQSSVFQINSDYSKFWKLKSNSKEEVMFR